MINLLESNLEMRSSTTLFTTRSSIPTTPFIKLNFVLCSVSWRSSSSFNFPLRVRLSSQSRGSSSAFICRRFTLQPCLQTDHVHRFTTSASVSSLNTQPPPDPISLLRQQFETIQSRDNSQISRLVESQFSFELDDFQRNALNSLCSNENVVLSAPTGAGKTVIGEMAIYLALCHNLRLFYTTPLKALSNQKFYDFKRQFGASRVGLLTGDVTVNRDASIIVMTTEIYRNMLYAEATEQREGPPLTDGLYSVVFDEFHYLNDHDRGTVWEESVINTPSHILMVALSATMSNAQQVSDWFQAVQGKTALIQSTVRPVPLNFGFLDFEGLTPLFANEGSSKGKGNMRLNKVKGFSKRNEQPVREKSEPKMHPKLLRKLKDETSRDRRSRIPSKRLTDDEVEVYQKLQKIVSRNERRRSSPGIPSFPFVVRTLYRRGMLPGIIFIFSRAGCDRAARIAASESQDLVDSDEREEIQARLDAFVTQNPNMVQPDRLKQALCGVASHHAGLLPLWKVCIEELFQDGLIKVVFATETLASGLNAPAKTTVISSLSKRAGEEGIRLLTTSEVLQMAGRAGRRGKDTVGNSVILRSRKEGAIDAFKILTQDVDKLESRFTPTYGMVLNLLLSRPLSEAKTLVDRSFGNYLRLQEQIVAREERKRGGRANEKSELDLDRLRRERNAFLSIIQEARDRLSAVNESDLRAFVKSLERMKAEKRALAYLVQQSSEIDAIAIQEALAFAPPGTKLLLRERIKPSSGSERRQKRREFTAAITAAGDGDEGAELRSFFFGGDESDLEELREGENDKDTSEIEAVLLDLHAETLDSGGQSAFSAVDADGRLRFFTNSAVTNILFDDEIIDVENITTSWDDITLPPRSSWRSLSFDQYEAPLPPSLTDIVPHVQLWRDERARTQTELDASTSPPLVTSPEIHDQRLRVEEAQKMAREQTLYKCADLTEVLAAKRAIPRIEAVLNGTKDPFERKKRRRKGNYGGRYAVLDLDKDQNIDGLEDHQTGTQIDGDSSTWDEFMGLVGVLQHYGMLDDEYAVTSLGELAAKVRSENELWTSLALLEPELEGVSPIHLAAILGATQMSDGSSSRGDSFVEWELSEEVRTYVERLNSTRMRLAAVQAEFGAQVGIGLDAEMMGLVEMWASGLSWVELLRRQSLQEGDVCRILRRTLDILRQVVHLPPIVSENLKRNARRSVALLDRFPITDDRTYRVDEDDRSE